MVQLIHEQNIEERFVMKNYKYQLEINNGFNYSTKIETDNLTGARKLAKAINKSGLMVVFGILKLKNGGGVVRKWAIL
jgi:hypothetical protein